MHPSPFFTVLRTKRDNFVIRVYIRKNSPCFSACPKLARIVLTEISPETDLSVAVGKHGSGDWCGTIQKNRRVPGGVGTQRAARPVGDPGVGACLGRGDLDRLSRPVLRPARRVALSCARYRGCYRSRPRVALGRAGLGVCYLSPPRAALGRAALRRWLSFS